MKAFGGIEPDIEVKIDAESEIYTGLLSKDMFFKFANSYIEKSGTKDSYMPGDEIFSQFKIFISENNFSYDSQIEKKLKEIQQLARTKLQIRYSGFYFKIEKYC